MTDTEKEPSNGDLSVEKEPSNGEVSVAGPTRQTTLRPACQRRKLIAAVREMVGLLSAAELADLIEHIKAVIRRPPDDR